jgi:hypothetical protein
MRNILLTSATLALLAAGPAFAQESATTPPNAPAAGNAVDTDAAVTGSTAVDQGVAVGGTAGAVTGAIVGGPVGAVIGGFAGAMLGTAAAVPEPAVDYVVGHPVAPVVIEGGISAGMAVPEAVELTPIPDYPEYAYIYVDGRPVLVRMESREVVYSPGYVVAPQTVTYVESNPLDPVVIDGDIAVGTVVPDSVELVAVPSDPSYAYVYTDAGPVLVNTSSRTVVWVKG